MRIATWNVNSIKARLPTVLQVLQDINADVVCLQELKCETDAFPYLEIEEQGWSCLVHGQKTYNGVAILSKFPLEDMSREMSTLIDEQSRYVEALVLADRPVRVGGLYLPNGNPAPGEKYDYKLEWIAALEDHAYAQAKIAEICRVRERTREALLALGMQVPPSETNFLFARHPRTPGKELFAALRGRDILVRHFDTPRLTEYLRISIGTEPQMDTVVETMRTLLTEMGCLP